MSSSTESRHPDHGDGEKLADLNALIPELYDELHARAEAQLRREKPGQTLQPTALIHEVYLRLVREKTVDAKSRSHFLAIASRKMRQILLNRCRPTPRRPAKDAVRVELRDDDMGVRDVDYVDFESALERLREIEDGYVDLLWMRLIGGMSTNEIGEALGKSARTVQRDLKVATMMLFDELKLKPNVSGDS